MVDAVADAEVMLGTTNEDGGWEKGGFGVSAADEKPSTAAAQSCNIVCVGLKKGNVRGSSHRGLTGTISGVSDSTRDWGNGKEKKDNKVNVWGVGRAMWLD